ncbi:MAG: DUF2784 domain-containing protein [Verrucomicrobiota bacterium]
MMSKLLADILVLFHLGFIAFAFLGGLLVLRWRWVAILHLPSVLWGVLVEMTGWICPLTPLEQRLREAEGESAYTGGFVDHYIMPLIYPEGLTRGIQFVLAFVVIAINLCIYGLVVAKRFRTSSGADPFDEKGDGV